MGELTIGYRPQLDTGYVAQARDLSTILGVRFHDDLFKLSDLIQFAIRIDRELKGLGITGGRGAELSGGDFRVLLLEGCYDVAWHKAALLELIGLEPDAHAVFPRSEDRHAAYAGDTREFILEVQRGVVIQIKRIEFILRGSQRDELQDGCGFGLGDHALGLHG